jgi:outer membrane protein OmpA-like peptidoglycan-associated protein
VSTIATAKPDRQADLETLRRILLADERDSIETLRLALKAIDDRVGDEERFTDSVTKSLVAAFRAAEVAQHRELAEALSPLVLAGIRREIVESRDLMVEALYPITGRLVATAVARAFQGLVAEINAKLEAAVSPLNWRRRAKSLLTGRPLAEVILSETAGFRLERILLIDRASGALLATWSARKDETGKDAQTALMGGLLSAVVAFSREAFEGDGHDLRALDLGDRVVMLRSSARRIVAAVGQGAVGGQLEARTDSAFLNFLESSAEADDEAKSHALLGSLASSLAPQPAPARARGTPVPLLIVATMLVAALGYWGLHAFEARRSEQRLDAALVALGERVGSGGGALTLVRDAPAHTVKAIGFLPSEATRRDLEEAIARELPGYRLDAQIVTATGGPDSLDVTMRLVPADRSVHHGSASETGGAETVAGQTSSENLSYLDRINRLERAIASLRLDTEGRFKSTDALVTAEADRVRASIDEATSALRDARRFLSLDLSGYAVFFEQGSSYRSPADADRDLDAIASLLKDKPGPRIRLIGHGDDLGSRATNLKIARVRAEKVASDLVVRGIEPTRLVLAARDGSQEIAEAHGVGSPNRRVTFELAYISE